MSTRIFIPNDTSACSVGADAVAVAVQAAIERTGIDARIVRNGSRGAYALEPLLEIDGDGGRIGYARVTPARAAEIFARGLPDRAAPECVGAVDALPFLAGQHRLTFARAGVVDPLDLDAFRAMRGFEGLTRARAMSSAQIVDEIRRSGLRGRGGAAFPAGVKWQTVLDSDAPAKYVVCNADEGDSGTFADRLLIEADPFQLIEGMLIAALATGADSGFVYLRSEYPRARDVFERALAIARRAGVLGRDARGPGLSFDIELRLGAGAYVCGEETSLLESIEGRRPLVRAKPPVPALQGLFGAPTLIHNVLSLAAATTILADGGDAYAALGVGRSRGTMPFQLAGNVAHGGIVELPFGATLRTLVESFGGGSFSGRPLRAVQVGGPLGAYLPPSEWDLPLDYEAFAARGAMLGHGGVVAFDDTTDFAEQAEFAMRFCAHESCGKCTPCRIGSQRGAEVIARIRAGESPDANIALLEDLCETMELGSLCALGGLTPMPVRSTLRYFREDFSREDSSRDGSRRRGSSLDDRARGTDAVPTTVARGSGE
jgi:formate dehydrogenase iron-sulfur subunit